MSNRERDPYWGDNAELPKGFEIVPSCTTTSAGDEEARVGRALMLGERSTAPWGGAINSAGQLSTNRGSGWTKLPW